MSRKANGVNYGKTVTQQSRRRRALAMLEQQLKSGVKTEKKTFDKKVPLTEKDVKRLNKEINILKDRL